MTALDVEMESYRRILDELVRQVESQEHARQNELQENPSSTPLDLDERIDKLDSHIRALSRATKGDWKAHGKLLDFMRRTTTIVACDSENPRKPLRTEGKSKSPT